MTLKLGRASYTIVGHSVGVSAALFESRIRDLPHHLVKTFLNSLTKSNRLHYPYEFLNYVPLNTNKTQFAFWLGEKFIKDTNAK